MIAKNYAIWSTSAKLFSSTLWFWVPETTTQLGSFRHQTVGGHCLYGYSTRFRPPWNKVITTVGIRPLDDLTYCAQFVNNVINLRDEAELRCSSWIVIRLRRRGIFWTVIFGNLECYWRRAYTFRSFAQSHFATKNKKNITFGWWGPRYTLRAQCENSSRHSACESSKVPPALHKTWRM